MGSSSSKAARGAARQFPTRAPGAAVTRSAAPRANAETRQTKRSKPLGGGIKDEAVRADSMDPDSISGDFSRRLKEMGIAEPNPTFSPSSTAFAQSLAPEPAYPDFPAARNNATLSVLEARRQLQQLAEEDFEAQGRASSQGRRFLDMRTLVQAQQLRERGVPTANIEQQLRLQPRLLERLGRPSIISHVASAGN